MFDDCVERLKAHMEGLTEAPVFARTWTPEQKLDVLNVIRFILFVVQFCNFDCYNWNGFALIKRACPTSSFGTTAREEGHPSSSSSSSPSSKHVCCMPLSMLSEPMDLAEAPSAWDIAENRCDECGIELFNSHFCCTTCKPVSEFDGVHVVCWSCLPIASKECTFKHRCRFPVDVPDCGKEILNTRRSQP